MQPIPVNLQFNFGPSDCKLYANYDIVSERLLVISINFIHESLRYLFDIGTNKSSQYSNPHYLVSSHGAEHLVYSFIFYDL